MLVIKKLISYSREKIRWKSMATVSCLVIPTFFKMSSFVFNRRNKLKQVFEQLEGE